MPIAIVEISPPGGIYVEITGGRGPQGEPGTGGGVGGAILNVTQQDIASPTVAIYYGGTWSDDGRWQITKSVAGVQTRATILNNSGVANLTAAWAARASLTYG